MKGVFPPGWNKVNGGKPDAVFVGVLPPPVTGMVLAIGTVVRHIKHKCNLAAYNLSHGKYCRGRIFRVRKGIAFLLATVKLCFCPSGLGSCFYKGANSRCGLYYDIVLISIARLLGYRIFLHHHVYSYLHKPDWRMALIAKVMGDRGVHIVLCRTMRERLQEHYPNATNIRVLSNAINLSDTEAQQPAPVGLPIRLGHISNLTVEKGFDLVVETYEALRKRDVPVELVLAGPLMSDREQQLFSDVKKEHGDHLDYRGPVYGEDKTQFYRDIDVMLFPTKYYNEAQPLVINEALSAGVPVISFERACIPRQIGDEGGVVVQQDPVLFIHLAVDILTEWAGDWEKLRQAKVLAAHRGRYLLQRSRRQLESLLTAMAESGRKR